MSRRPGFHQRPCSECATQTHRGGSSAHGRSGPPADGADDAAAHRCRGTLGGSAFCSPAPSPFISPPRGAHPFLPGIPCPLRALTGIPCPTCFLTRAIAAALNGRLSESLQLHAFGIPLALLLLGWSGLAIQRRLLPPFPLRGRALAWAAAAIGLYWLLRVISLYALGLPAFPRG